MTELPLSLSIVTAEGLVCRMLEKGTGLPASKTRVFTSPKKIPAAVAIELVMGERENAKADKTLIKLRLPGVKRTVGRVVRIAVKLDVSEEGNITLEAFDYGSHHKRARTLEKDKWIPSEEEIKAAVDDAQAAYEEESLIRERCRNIDRAKNLIIKIRTIDRSDREKYTPQEWNELKKRTAAFRKRVAKLNYKNMTPVDDKSLPDEINAISALVKN